MASKKLNILLVFLASVALFLMATKLSADQEMLDSCAGIQIEGDAHGSVTSNCYITVSPVVVEGASSGVELQNFTPETSTSIVEDQNPIDAYALSCNEGDRYACNALAVAYDEGTIVEQDYLLAFQAVERSCSLGYLVGCRNLGLYYRLGRGVEIDLERGFRIAEQACDDGQGLACFDVGESYRRSIGVFKSYFLAKTYFIKSCQLGEAQGCSHAGIMYEIPDDNFVKADLEDLEDSLKFYQMGCDRGDDYGCFELGRTYKFGNDLIDVDLEKAREFLMTACIGYESSACAYLD